MTHDVTGNRAARVGVLLGALVAAWGIGGCGAVEQTPAPAPMPPPLGTGGAAGTGGGGGAGPTGTSGGPGSGPSAGAGGQEACGAVFRPAMAPVEPAVSAGYQWSACGEIAPQPASRRAVYGADGSILSLDERGVVLAFAVDSTTAPTTLARAAGASEFMVSSDGTRLLVWGEEEAALYRAEEGVIGVASGELSLVGNLDTATAGCGGVSSPSFTPPPVAFSADGALVVALGEKKACAWDAVAEQLRDVALEAIPDSGGVSWPALVGAEAGGATLTAFRGGLLQRYALSGELLTSFDLRPSWGDEPPFDTALSVDARTLLAAFSLSAGGWRLSAFDTQTGSLRWHKDLGTPPHGPVLLSPSKDGYVLASGFGVYAIEDGAQLATDKASFAGTRAALGTGGLAKLVPQMQVAEWDEEQQHLRRLYGAHSHSIRALEVSADGRYLASNDGWAVVWELAEDFGRSIPRYNGVAPDSSWNVALAPHGGAMVVSGDNVAYYQRGGGFVPIDAPPQAADVGCLSADWAFSPDGCWVVGTRYGRDLLVHDARDFSLAMTLDTDACGRGVAFSPDGAYLMTANLELFRTEGWQRLQRFGAMVSSELGGPGAEHAVEFSPDGREVLITRPAPGGDARAYASVRYEAETGKQLDPMPLGGERPRYSPEGHWIVSGGSVWHAPSGTRAELVPDATVSVFTPQGDIIAGKSDGSLVRYRRSGQ